MEHFTFGVFSFVAQRLNSTFLVFRYSNFCVENTTFRVELRDRALYVYLVIALHSVDRPIPCYVEGVGLHGGGGGMIEDIGAEKTPEHETGEQPHHIYSAQDS